MLPGGTDSLYRSILAAPHEAYTRIEVWSAAGLRLDPLVPQMQRSTWLAQDGGGLDFLTGEVIADLNNRVARNLTLQVPQHMYPWDPADLLAPFGNEIRAYHGVLLGDGSQKYVWQVFRGRIQNVVQSSDGTCTIMCSDRAMDVQDVNFASPQNSQPANSINEEWQRLIIDAVPNATFGTSDVFAKLVQPLTWEFDRASALDEMTRSVGAIGYALANGDFVLRRFPWAVESSSIVNWADDGPGATVSAWQVTRARTSIFNLVTVTGERLNGDAPVYASASDSTTGSPTSITGNFGLRSLVERLQNPATQGGAQDAAESLLRTYISPIQEWTLEIVPDAALELGDTGTVMVDGHTDLQVVARFTLPLGQQGNMSVSTRSIVVGAS